MNPQSRFYWIWGLGTLVISTIVGFVAYHAGQTSQIVTTTAGDGRLVYPGYYGGFGFFPFFGLFWILLIGFLFFRFIFWRPWGRGPGRWGGHYHDHSHDQPSTTTPPPATKPGDPTIA
jgi:hypothetical protein